MYGYYLFLSMLAALMRDKLPDFSDGYVSSDKLVDLCAPLLDEKSYCPSIGESRSLAPVLDKCAKMFDGDGHCDWGVKFDKEIEQGFFKLFE